MYLFTRTARLRPGRLSEATTWATGITAKVNQITELDVRLWTPVFSPGVGTLVWSAFTPDLVALEAAFDKLAVDDGYADLVDQGAAFITDAGADDAVAEVVFGDIDPARHPAYGIGVRSMLANGAFQRGVETGIEIAQFTSEVGGAPTLFLLTTTGLYGSVAWLTGAASMEELERINQAVDKDPRFVELIDTKAKDVFLPGISSQTIYRRLV